MVCPSHLIKYQFLPKERSAAKAEGKTQYFTGKPCKHGHISLRVTSSGSCVTCANISEKKSRSKKLKANPDFYKKYYAEKSEALKIAAKSYRFRNPEKIKISLKAYKIKNRSKFTALEMERQARKINATPKWLTVEHEKQIYMIYMVAQQTTLSSGYKCHVDHIVPLKGKGVCGLHVPWNLRVVSQSYNSKKHNSLDEAIFYPPSLSGGVLIHSSALPWNWSK